MATLKKLDLRKQLKDLYAPTPKAVEKVQVPPMYFLMIDGQGDPNTAPMYAQAVEVLYAVSYALKFLVKPAGLDYAVMPLEGLWWQDDMGEKYGDIDFMADKSRWKWTVMIMQPEQVVMKPQLFAEALQEVEWKKNPPLLDQVRLDCFDEGLAAQVMHIGPYSAEKPTIDRVHNYIASSGHEPTGKHHEIYVGDPCRTAPEKLKTIIRQPMQIPAY